MKKFVILLHGYGSNGHDLSGLGEFWSGALPELSYASPDAPQLCEAGIGYQWFSLANITPENRIQRMAAARPAIDALLDGICQQQGIDPKQDQILLVGFSQGTMVALDILLRGKLNVVGVIGFSGRLIDDSNMLPIAGTEVLLVHGEADEVVPYQETLSAQEKLNKLGIPCHYLIEPEVVHTISSAGIEAATQFLVERFGLDDDEAME